MFIILIIAAGLLMLYTVVTLAVGATNMARTGEGARERSNSWMWKRVGAQALAIFLLYIAFKVRGG